MQIQVLLSPDQDVNVRVKAIFEEVNEVMDKLLKVEPILGFKPIEIIYDINAPRVIPVQLEDIYQIALSRQDDYWNQLVYQYAHEMCHVYIDPRVTNWLVEAFCECISRNVFESRQNQRGNI